MERMYIVLQLSFVLTCCASNETVSQEEIESKNAHKSDNARYYSYLVFNDSYLAPIFYPILLKPLKAIPEHSGYYEVERCSDGMVRRITRYHQYETDRLKSARWDLYYKDGKLALILKSTWILNRWGHTCDDYAYDFIQKKRLHPLHVRLSDYSK
jgi:hypothetical protein